MQPNGFSYTLGLYTLLLLVLWQSDSCQDVKVATMSQEQRKVATGMWGGQNAQLDVSEDGAQIRFSCAQGKIELPLMLDAEGRFSAKGTFMAEGMGPRREDDPPKYRPAVYSGVVRDKVLTLTVTVADSKDEGGTFELTLGAPGRIRRCH